MASIEPPRPPPPPDPSPSQPRRAPAAPPDPSPSQPEREPAASLPPSSVPTAGPSFLLFKRKDGESLAQANPFALRRQLVALCGEVRKAKALRSRALLVETRTGSQARTLLEVTNLANHDVTVTLADRMNTVCGSIRAEALIGLSNSEILAELSSQGVCRVERLASRRLATLGPNPTIKVNFRGKTLPQSVLCGYLVVPVSPWVPAPTQCRNCWQSGHPSRNCRRRAGVCGRCAGGHPTDGCTAPPVCPNCQGPHPAWDRSCEYQREIREYHFHRQNAAKRAHKAQGQGGGATWPLPPEEWPPLVPPPPPTEPRPPPLSPPEPTRPRSPDQGARQGAGQVARQGAGQVARQGADQGARQGADQGARQGAAQGRGQASDDGGDNNTSATGPSEAHSSPSAATTSPFGSAPTATSSPTTWDSSPNSTLKAATPRSRPTHRNKRGNRVSSSMPSRNLRVSGRSRSRNQAQ